MEKTGFNKHDIARDACQLYGAQAHKGYDWWWHSFNNLTSELTGKKLMDSVFDIGGNGIGTIQLYDRHGNLVDRIHAENIGCEYGEYMERS